MKNRLTRYLRDLQEFNATGERLTEVFIKASEINSMPKGRLRDMQMLRLATIAEFDAANLYEMMADLSSVPDLRKLFLSISNEEKIHVGEFEFALEHVDPEHDHFQKKGEDEAEGLGKWSKKGVTEDAKKESIKDQKKANQMRCKTIEAAILRRRNEIKALILQGRQWECE